MTVDRFNYAEDTCLNNHHSACDLGRGSHSEFSPSKSASELEKSTLGEERQDRGSHGLTPRELVRQPSAEPALDYPDGGLEAWLVVFGSFCAMVAVFGMIQVSAVFESYFAANQLAEYNASQIGWIFSLYLFIVFFVGIQVGPIFDRYGARMLVAAGSLLLAVGIIMLGFCTEYYQIILSYSVLGGLGGALLNTPSYGAIAHYFDARRGLAIGIATTSGAIGGIVFPIILQHLFPRVGFAWACHILGFILLALAVPANLFIRTRLPPIIRADGGAKMSSVLPDFTIFRDLRFSLTALGIFFMEWGLFMPITFIVSYAAAHGQDLNGSYLLLSYFNAGSVVGRVVPGFCADKFGRFNSIVITISLCIATTLGLWLPAHESTTLMITYAVLFGFASGSNLSLAPVALGQLCDSREYGRYLSTAMMAASFGTLSGVPIGGALLGLGGETGWSAMILFSGLAYAVALLCFAAARVLAVGWNFRRKF